MRRFWQLCALAAAPVLSAEQALEAGLEWMAADDVSVSDGLFRWRLDGPRWDHRLALSGGWIEIDYRPAGVDIFGHEETVSERRLSAEWSARYRLAEAWRLEGTLGGYDGFTGYRSLWVSRWYAQFFDGLPGLEAPDPRGALATLAARWEYLPATGFVSLAATVARDHIAPGYDEVMDEFGGVIGVEPLRSELDTVALALSAENVLSPRLRSRIDYRLANQSERQLRHSLTGELRFALSKQWFARFEAGGTREAGNEEAEQDFSAGWGGMGLTWELSARWALDLYGGYYEDNGEIENAIGFSSAAPAVSVRSGRIGLRYTRGDHAWRLAFGHRSADYDPIEFRHTFFGPLYEDRDFVTFTAAYRWSF